MAEIDDLSFETDEVVAAESSEDSLFGSLNSIVSFVTQRFKRSEDSRLNDEERWLRSYRNYRGIYGPEVQFTSTEKSKVFVKVTKTKTLAAYGQIVEGSIFAALLAGHIPKNKPTAAEKVTDPIIAAIGKTKGQSCQSATRK